MKKGLVLLVAFILTAAFSVEIFAGEPKANFGVKKREKKVVEQRMSQESVKEAPTKKAPLMQPLAEATISATTATAGIAKNIIDAMYSTVVDAMVGRIEQMKEKQASGKPSDIK